MERWSEGRPELEGGANSPSHPILPTSDREGGHDFRRRGVPTSLPGGEPRPSPGVLYGDLGPSGVGPEDAGSALGRRAPRQAGNLTTLREVIPRGLAQGLDRGGTPLSPSTYF